jgi:hypothetical protein
VLTSRNRRWLLPDRHTDVERARWIQSGRRGLRRPLFMDAVPRRIIARMHARRLPSGNPTDPTLQRSSDGHHLSAAARPDVPQMRSAETENTGPGGQYTLCFICPGSAYCNTGVNVC